MATNLRVLRHWTSNTVSQNARLTHGYVPTAHTVLVRFRYRLRSDRSDLADMWRTASVLVETTSLDGSDFAEALAAIQQALMQHYEDFGDYTREDAETGHTLFINPQSGAPDVQVTERLQLMRHDTLLRHLGFPEGVRSINPETGRATARSTRMYGWFDDLQPQHRAFRYLVEGCDVRTLQAIIPEADIHPECDKTCVYKMLEDRNPPTPKQPNRMFRREAVNTWLNQNGRAVGGLTDGVCSDDIQAHAIQHRYAHLAMDLGRSVLNLHVPEQRNTHFKPVCYYLVGDHCQPIVDTDTIKSVLTTATNRLGTRTWSGYQEAMAQGKMSSDRHAQDDLRVGRMSVTQQENRKRARSLDRNFRVDRSESYKEHLNATQPWQAPDAPVDIEVEEWDEDYEDNGSQSCVPMGSDAQRTKSRSWQFPLVTDTDRFHYFTKENDRALIEERCHPNYREGEESQKIHYYVCTDETDVEFLYQYLLLIRSLDPLRYARSYNGRCRTLRLNNVYWCANPDIQEVLRLHQLFHPTEPFRMTSLATYGFRMLHQELSALTRSPHTLWNAMCQYSPNLQRLMDNLNPFNRPKICQRTYNPPYSDPRNNAGSNGSVTTLIPWSQRRRVDLIRSYASTLWALDADGTDNVDGLFEYPVHDITNKVVPYDETIHGRLPPGHYLVDIPSSDDQKRDGTADDWAKLPCFEPGEPRMVSHRMVRGLLNRGLISKTAIRLACPTQSARQHRFGKAVAAALRNVTRKIYTHPELQDPTNRTVKSLVNHLVGICNGTTLAHSGMRYHFNDLKNLWCLLCTTYAEDSLRHTKVFHRVGHDPYWHKAFDYYELDGSGLSHRHFHFQPIFTMVLEDQALRIFDLARPIPLANLIQINIDAVEYQFDPIRQPTWAQQLEDGTVTEEVYKALTPKQLLEEGYLGRPKTETPKGENKALFYHFHYNRPTQQTLQTRFLTLADLHDTESTETVNDWHSTLRAFEPGDQIRQVQFTDDYINQWIQEGDDSTLPTHNRSGLLVTGPAGTGKTHFLRHLYEGCLKLKYRVLRTAFTHAACIQMGFDAQTLSSVFGIDPTGNNCTRRTLIFSRRFAAHLRSLRLDVLMVDEISMIPLSILECLMLFHRVCTNTRIVLSGDYNQLPPVEDSDYLSVPRFDAEGVVTSDSNRAGMLKDYFEGTDIIPYLLYDRVRNTGGRWMRLTECLRTDDPLLKRIAENPSYVVSIRENEYPVPNVPVWRYICFTNRVRKACNWYCMQRYLDTHPTYPRVVCNLRDLYADQKFASQKNARQERDVFLKEWDRIQARMDGLEPLITANGPYIPGHWKYLQPYVYAAGMEVVCRCTLRGERVTGTGTLAGAKDVGDLEIKNNRRAMIWSINLADQPEDIQKGRRPTITIRWLDRMKSSHPDESAEIPPTKLQPWQIPTDESDDPLPMDLYDFAFHFVPGFCITAHMAQGETINEHYGVMEWRDMVKDARMAYVAVTRGRSTSLLHLVPWYTDPSGRTDTTDVQLNLMRALYRMYTQRTTAGVVAPCSLTDYDWLLRRLRVSPDKPEPPLSPPLCDVCLGSLRVSHYPTNPQLRDSDLYQQQFTVFFDTETRSVRLRCMRCKEADASLPKDPPTDSV